MIKKLLAALQLWAQKNTYRKAVKAANKENALTGRKVFVVLFKGEFIALTKKKLKKLRAAGQMSNDAVKQIEKFAVYSTK
jgi:hypothetical protein